MKRLATLSNHIMLIFLIILIIAVPGLSSNQTVSAKDLTYITEQYPPYNYKEDGKLQGISVDLLEKIWDKMGADLNRSTIKLLPWTEGYQTTLKENNTVLFTTFRPPEREHLFKWIGPIASGRDVLLAKRDKNIIITTPEDMKKFKIGAIKDDVAVQWLLNKGLKKEDLILETTPKPIIEMLENGSIDAWAYNDLAGMSLLQQLGARASDYKVAFVLAQDDGYYAFNNNTSNSTVQSFQQALDAVKAEKNEAGISSYETTLGNYIPPIGLAHLNYLTEEWAPFNYQEGGNVTGIAVGILEAIFKNIGVNRSHADVHIVPLAEGFNATKNGSTVLFSIVRTPEREPYYKWVGPFTMASFVLFAPMASNITIGGPEDLNRYRIGAVKSSIENTLLLNQGVNASHIVPGRNPEDLLKLLEDGQIDLWATGDLAGRHQMLKTAKDPNAYEIVYTLSENDFYFIFSKNVPDTLVRAFKQSLDTVRDQKDEHGISEYESIIYQYLGAGCIRKTYSDEAVKELVNTTAAALQKNASDTLRRINDGEAPYRNKTDPGLYAFVYTTNETIVAHADNIMIVGVNFKGKTDVSGKLFHDEIVQGALKNGTGWVDYIYMHPVQTNLYYKTTYYRLVEGSDGVQYIVCSGNYKRCE